MGERGKGKRYGNVWNLPFPGDCAWLQVAHCSVRAYGYFKEGHLKDLSVFSQGGPPGPLCIPSLKPVCLKVASRIRFLDTYIS